MLLAPVTAVGLAHLFRILQNEFSSSVQFAMRIRTLSSRFFNFRKYDTNTSEWSEEMGNERWNQDSKESAQTEAA
jgi:hypothetical protein